MSVIRGLEWSLRKLDKDFIPNLRKFTVWQAPLHGHAGATFSVRVLSSLNCIKTLNQTLPCFCLQISLIPRPARTIFGKDGEPHHFEVDM